MAMDQIILFAALGIVADVAQNIGQLQRQSFRQGQPIREIIA